MWQNSAERLAHAFPEHGPPQLGFTDALWRFSKHHASREDRA
jgi:hypothetical protein